MAWTVAHTNSGTTTLSGSTLKLTIATTTTGNMLVVCVQNNNTATVTGVAMTPGSGTFTVQKAITGGNPAEIWAAANTTGGTTPVVTATFSATPSAGSLVVYEVSGGPTAITLDGTNSATQTGATAASTGAITTTVNGDLVFKNFNTSGSMNGTAQTSWTEVNPSAEGGSSGFIVQTTSGSITGTDTASSSSNNFGVIAAFKPASGPTTFNDIVSLAPGSLITPTPSLSLKPSVVGTSGTLLSLTTQDKHLVLGGPLPGALLSPVTQDIHQASGSLVPGSLLSPVSRDKHQVIDSSVPGVLLTLANQGKHQAASGLIPGALLTLTSQDKHLASGPSISGTVLSLTSRDSHKGAIPIAPGSLVTANDLLLFNEQVAVASGALLTLGDLLSSRLQVGILSGSTVSVQSSDAHKSVAPLTPGIVLGLNPSAKLVDAVSIGAGGLLTLSSLNGHAGALLVSAGAVVGLTSRDTHQASTGGTLIPAINWEDPAWDWEDGHFWEEGASGSGGLSPGTVLGLNAVNSAGGTITDSLSALPGVLLSLASQDRHLAFTSVVAGSVTGATSIIGIRGALSIVLGSVLSVTARDSHSDAEAISSQNVLTLTPRIGLSAQESVVSGTLVSVISKDLHGGVWASVPGSVLSPAAIVFGTTIDSIPIAAGNLLSLTSRDTHRFASSFSPGSVVLGVSSVKHRPSLACAASTIVSVNPSLLVNQAFNAVSGITETLATLDTVTASIGFIPGNSVFENGRMQHSGAALFDPSVVLGLSGSSSHGAQTFFSPELDTAMSARLVGSTVDNVNQVNPLNAAPKVLTRNRRIY